MSTASVTDLADFLSARFGVDAPQQIARFRASLLADSDQLGAARLACVQALWTHSQAAAVPTVDAVDMDVADDRGWPRVYIGGA